MILTIQGNFPLSLSCMYVRIYGKPYVVNPSYNFSYPSTYILLLFYEAISHILMQIHNYEDYDYSWKSSTKWYYMNRYYKLFRILEIKL